MLRSRFWVISTERVVFYFLFIKWLSFEPILSGVRGSNRLVSRDQSFISFWGFREGMEVYSILNLNSFCWIWTQWGWFCGLCLSEFQYSTKLLKVFSSRIFSADCWLQVWDLLFEHDISSVTLLYPSSFSISFISFCRVFTIFMFFWINGNLYKFLWSFFGCLPLSH